MARAGFKRRLARVLPESAERATFVVASALALLLLFGAWRPMPSAVWTVPRPWSIALWIAYAAGWLLVVASTFMIDHWDFLGLRQAYQRPYAEPPFRERWLYVWVRHPMMLGLLIAFWATPNMTEGHLLFAVASSAYIAVGIRFEERDLRRRLGEPYGEYADRVRALVPVRRNTA
jgi:protein-S-isoprenylcysteine O-methyltransferase Ste14